MGASGNGCPFLFFAPLASTIIVPMGVLREGASAKIASPSTQFWSLFNKLRQVKDAGHGGWLLFEGLYKKVPPTSGRRNL